MENVIKYSERMGYIANPYIGIVSFQHFRDDVLYSDVIVDRQKGGMCETENYECYPVTEGVEEKGREQGYYPDSTVAYIRVLWKEFEPKQGEYNYALIEDILQKAREHNQTVMFRLMPHSTCERDDVPEWLKSIVSCPKRPNGQRVKDSPTDERYIRLFGKAIEMFAKRFDKDDTLDIIDICLPGSWGEGFKLHRYSDEILQWLMDVYANNFKNTKLIGQVAAPKLVNYLRQKTPVGWRGDGTGDPYHMNDYFPQRVKDMLDVWKTAPVSFEAFWWLKEWQRQGWDIDETIEKTLGWHISTFNPKSFPIPYEWREKIERWILKMGYRFVARSARFDDTIKAGESFSCQFTVENIGVAPIYNKLPLSIVLRGENCEKTLDCEVDITKWLPGEWTEEVRVVLPKDLQGGKYSIALRIGGNKKPVVHFANEEEKDGILPLGTLFIENVF